MKEIEITQPVNRLLESAESLAANYKYDGCNRWAAWDRFIIDRGLKPEINAKEFYKVFDKATPKPIETRVIVQYEATHWDTLLDMECQITDDEFGVHHIIWGTLIGFPHGTPMTGSEPPNSPNFKDRYMPIASVEDDDTEEWSFCQHGENPDVCEFCIHGYKVWSLNDEQ